MKKGQSLFDRYAVSVHPSILQNDAALADLYRQHALPLPPGGLSPRAQNSRSGSSRLEASAIQRIKLKRVEVAGRGWRAYEIGDYSVYDDHDRSISEGTYVAVWRQIQGTWILDRDIWNSGYILENVNDPEPGILVMKQNELREERSKQVCTITGELFVSLLDEFVDEGRLVGWGSLIYDCEGHRNEYVYLTASDYRAFVNLWKAARKMRR